LREWIVSDQEQMGGRMDADKRARLTRLLWRDRLKWFLWPGVLLLVFGAFYLTWLAESWTPVRFSMRC
jgi:hypothetical protein